MNLLEVGTSSTFRNVIGIMLTTSNNGMCIMSNIAFTPAGQKYTTIYSSVGTDLHARSNWIINFGILFDIGVGLDVLQNRAADNTKTQWCGTFMCLDSSESMTTCGAKTK